MAVQSGCATACSQLFPRKTGVRLRVQGSEEEFDYAILAVPFDSLAKLLPELPGSNDLREKLSHFETAPITGVHLWFDRQITDLPHAVLLDRTIQWMFHKSMLLEKTSASNRDNGAKEGQDRAGEELPSYVELVISASKSLIEKSRQEITPASPPGVLRGRRRVALVRGEEADRVVAPVVRQPAVGQEPLGDVLVHRQQLDRGDAEVAQVPGRRLVREARVGAPDLRRDVRVARGEPLDVHLVDDRVRRRGGAAGRRPPSRRPACRSPGTGARTARSRPASACAGSSGSWPSSAPGRTSRRRGRPGRRGRGAAWPDCSAAPGRVERPLHPVAVGLAGLDAGDEAVPHPRVVVVELEPGLRAARRRTGTR